MHSEFEIDRDTFNDLEVFSERAGNDSLFRSFKNTRTSGARDLLFQMMNLPLSDINELIDRRDAIKYFYDHPIDLEITHNQIDLIEHYLCYNKRLLRDNPADALFDHYSNLIHSSSHYYIITAGVKNIIQVMKVLSARMLSIKNDKNAPRLIRNACDARLLNDKSWIKVLGSNKKISCFQINRFDRLFRMTKLQEAKELLKFIYELDIYETLAGFARRKKWTFPYYHASGSEINLTGLFHPAISEPVLNSFAAGPGKELVLITGSNMSGKSSFLKSLGLSVYLAHIGFPVPARRMETSVFSGLITTINLPDDINDGLSHYYSEVKRIKHTALKILEGKKLFVIFDELFRGTNPKDAFDASLLIIKALCKIPNCIFLISTHHAELAEELKIIPSICFKYFESSFEGEKPVFSYKMKDGVSYERSGMHIIKNEGVFEILEKVIKY